MTEWEQEIETFVSGDGGPLIVLQASAASSWQGASDFENSLMNGGETETDYDVICDCEEMSLLNRYERDMLVLWDSEFGANTLPPQTLGLSPDAIVITMAYNDEDLAEALPRIQRHVVQAEPSERFLMDVHDTSLRLQVGADAPPHNYSYLDIALIPGKRTCDIYLVPSDDYQDTVLVLRSVASEA